MTMPKNLYRPVEREVLAVLSFASGVLNALPQDGRSPIMLAPDEWEQLIRQGQNAIEAIRAGMNAGHALAMQLNELLDAERREQAAGGNEAPTDATVPAAVLTALHVPDRAGSTQGK